MKIIKEDENRNVVRLRRKRGTKSVATNGFVYFEAENKKTDKDEPEQFIEEMSLNDLVCQIRSVYVRGEQVRIFFIAPLNIADELFVDFHAWIGTGMECKEPCHFDYNSANLDHVEKRIARFLVAWFDTDNLIAWTRKEKTAQELMKLFGQEL